MKLFQSLTKESKHKLWKAYYENEINKTDKTLSKNELEGGLARELGVSVQTIRNYKKQKSCPQPGIIKRIIYLLPLTEILDIILPEVDQFLQDIMEILTGGIIDSTQNEPSRSKRLQDDLNNMAERVGRMKIEIWLWYRKELKEKGLYEDFARLLESTNMLEKVISGTQADLGQKMEKEFTENYLDKVIEYFGVLLEAYLTQPPNKEEVKVIPGDFKGSVNNIAIFAKDLMFGEEDNKLARDFKNYKGQEKSITFVQRITFASRILVMVLDGYESIDSDRFPKEISGVRNPLRYTFIGTYCLPIIKLEDDGADLEKTPYNRDKLFQKMQEEIHRKLEKLEIKGLENVIKETDNDELKQALKELKKEVETKEENITEILYMKEIEEADF